jgi:hypothetical protein
MVVDGKGESPSRLTSAVEGAEQRPIYHAAFDDVEYISAVPTCGSSGLTAGAEWIRTFGSAMRWHRRQRGRGVTRLIRAVSGGSSDRPPQLDWYSGTMPVAIL